MLMVHSSGLFARPFFVFLAHGSLRRLLLDPFSVLTLEELDIMKLNIEKRHVIGHNLSVTDKKYADTMCREKPGTTVEILAEEISEFTGTVKNIIMELE